MQRGAESSRATAGRNQRGRVVVASTVGYMVVGWYLSGIGAVLPELEEAVGRRASVYPLLVGAALLVMGVAAFVVGRVGAGRHATALAAAAGGLTAGVVVMGVTRWWIISAAGALTAATSAAVLIRHLPAALATGEPAGTQRALVQANAWSSAASIVAPLAVGAALAIGIGWEPGLVAPIAVGTAIVWSTLGVGALKPGRSQAADTPLDRSKAPVPPLATWWRQWVVLTLCIVVEFCFAYFAATFLHDERGLSTAAAAAGASAWGIGMACGRITFSVRPPPRAMAPSVALIAVGFAMLWLVSSAAVAIAGIGIAGIGASPLYPVRMSALLARFPGAADAGSARGALASGTALLGAPALMAGLRSISDVRTAYLAVPVLLLVLSAVNAGGRAYSGGGAASDVTRVRRTASVPPSPSS